MQLTLLKKRLLSALVLVVFSSFSLATVAEKNIIDNITKKLTALELSISTINPSIVGGLYEVLTDRGVYYISEDARFLVHGEIYDIDNQMENITEKTLTVLRQERLKTFEKEMIVYKAENEKHVVTVFTDTSCGYCQKLHSEMEDYNNLGITIRYLAFPRGGVKSNAYNTMVSIWCSDDPKLAMDKAKSRNKIKYENCENTVQDQYLLGQFFGVTGTPALVLEDGSLQPGYIPAARLLQLLDQHKG
ncbi:MAG: bifunctional protein-disulfide isomerase/oxidoreductase DsbC [Psychromonas sp.]